MNTVINNKNLIRPLNFFGFFLALIALESMHAWFLIENSQIIYALSMLCLILLSLTTGKRYQLRSFSLLAIIVYMIYSFRVVDYSSLNSLLGSAIRIIILGYVILLREEYKVLLFKKFVSIYVFVIFIGMPFWILDILTNSIPHFEYKVNSINADFSNSILFMSFADSNNFYRYMSVFLEPGHLGMISSLILFTMKYNFKNNKVKILAFSIFVSFSAAAYVISVLGYFLYLQNNNLIYNFRQKLFRLSFFILFFLVFLISAFTYSDGVLLSKINSVLGVNFMDVRLSSDFKRFYDAASYETLLYGIGNKEYMEIFSKGGSAGYKVFIIKYGLINLAILSFFYILIFLQYRERVIFFLLILYIVSFTQRAYAMWEIQILIFVLGSSYLTFEINKGSIHKYTKKF